MGADLTGYFVVAPRRVPDDAIEKVSELAVERLRDAREYVQGGARPSWVFECDDHFLDLQELVSSPDIEKRVKRIKADILAVMSGDFRDTVTRAINGPEGKIAIFAGDRTWGDEPDGWGYRTLKLLSVLRLMSVVGFE